MFFFSLFSPFSFRLSVFLHFRIDLGFIFVWCFISLFTSLPSVCTGTYYGKCWFLIETVNSCCFNVFQDIVYLLIRWFEFVWFHEAGEIDEKLLRDWGFYADFWFVIIFEFNWFTIRFKWSAHFTFIYVNCQSNVILILTFLNIFIYQHYSKCHLLMKIFSYASF